MFEFLKNVFGGGESLSSDCIVPRVKNRNFTTALLEQGIPEDQMTLVDPLFGELLITYAFDLPRSFQMVSENCLVDLGLTKEEVKSIAIENLRKQIPEIKRQGNPPLMTIVTGGNLEACVILLQEFWQFLSQKIPGKIVISVPHRDILFVTSSESEDGLKQIRKATADIFGKDKVHSLSPNLFAWDGNSWEVFEKSS
jgi:uncharacterized protein YtpQ (UPF0354 family)